MPQLTPLLILSHSLDVVKLLCRVDVALAITRRLARARSIEGRAKKEGWRFSLEYRARVKSDGDGVGDERRDATLIRSIARPDLLFPLCDC